MMMNLTPTMNLTLTVEHLDPVAALLAGRTHYKRPVPEPRGDIPTLQETLIEMGACCEAPMVPIEGQAGQPIGYRCPRCHTTASVDGRTEHGPKEIISTHMGKQTVLREPGVCAEAEG